VHNVLVREKIIKGPKKNVLPPKKKSVEDAKAKEAATQAKTEVKPEEKKEETAK